MLTFSITANINALKIITLSTQLTKFDSESLAYGKLIENLAHAIDEENINKVKELIYQHSDRIESIINHQIYVEMGRQHTDFEANLTLLHLACLKGKIEVIDLLLNNGGNPNDTQFYSKDWPFLCGNPLFTTIFRHKYFYKETFDQTKTLDIIELLIKHGADVNGANLDNNCEIMYLNGEMQEFLPLIALIIIHLSYDEICLKIVDILLKNGALTCFKIKNFIQYPTFTLLERLQVRLKYLQTESLEQDNKREIFYLQSLIHLFIEREKEAQKILQFINIWAKLKSEFFNT